MIGFRKDGGPLSKVEGWFLEAKKRCTLALLRFNPGTREAFHTHAFDACSLVLGPGCLEETFINGKRRVHKRGAVVYTHKDDFHQVRSLGTTYVVTLRGPWQDEWLEVDEDNRLLVLTHGRKVLHRSTTEWGAVRA